MIKVMIMKYLTVILILLNLCRSTHTNIESPFKNERKYLVIPRSVLDNRLSQDTWHHFPLCLQCEFLTDEAQSPDVSSSSSLQVAASDLKQLMATFNHVYDTELKAYCNREPPSFSSGTQVFQRVHHLLLALNTVRTCTGPSNSPPPQKKNCISISYRLFHPFFLSGTGNFERSNRCFCVHKWRRQMVTNTVTFPTLRTERHIPYVKQFFHQIYTYILETNAVLQFRNWGVNKFAMFRFCTIPGLLEM